MTDTRASDDPWETRGRDLKRRLIVALCFSVPVMVLSMVPPLQFPGWQWVCAVLALPVVTWCAWPFHAQAVQAARHGSTTMNTLVSLGIIASVGWSVYALIWGGAGAIGTHMSMSLLPRAMGHHAHVYFEGATMIATFLLLGRWLEARARHRAGDAIRSLLELGATSATVVRVDSEGRETEMEVPVGDLVEGDLVRVRPGQKVPTDGVVIAGTSAIDTSLVTGESLPVDVGPGDHVVGATLNTSGTLLVRATAVGADTMVAHIAQMVADAQAGKAPVQRLADKVSAVFVPTVLGIAVLTLAGWLIAGAAVQQAFTAAVSVLVIACPCALGLATPTALLVGSGRGAQLGIIFRGPEILEGSHEVDAVVLDKTGTLTTGVMEVERVVLPDGHEVPLAVVAEDATTPAADPGVPTDDDARAADLLAFAGAAESSSEHPLGRALTHAARDLSGGALPPLGRFGAHAGMGIHAVVGDTLVLAGRLGWLADLGLDVPDTLRRAAEDAAESGATVVAVGRGLEVSEAAPADPDADQNTEDAAGPEPLTLDFAIGGMSCAACVGRVERALNKVDGVDAQVNLATETARVCVPADSAGTEDPDALTAALVDAVTSAGYSARPLDGAAHATRTRAREDVLRPLASGEILGLVVVSDRVRPTSKAAIADLQAMGIDTYLATGDNAGAAQHVADAVGITHVSALVTPQDKRDLVLKLQGEGRHVAMVGDGINDAAALAQAGQRGLGMAMGQGTDVAIASADVTLMRSDVRGVVTAIRLGRRTLRIIKQNLAWAFGYNIVAIPLAIAGLANPMWAAAFMACSSVLVVTNSLRLRSTRE